MHTDNEWTKTEFGLESSKAWRNNLAMKLQKVYIKSLCLLNDNSKNLNTNLGLDILAASPGGAYLVIAQRASAAFACTSGQSFKKFEFKILVISS